MKINKVELQGFRAYKGGASGTFDFSTQDGDCSNFVAIYAPNGFGKTSFFDGVEWCLTNNIYRFIRRHNDNKNLSKFAQKDFKHKQLILRNHDSVDDDAFVKVHSNGHLYERAVPAVPRKGGRDYNFDDKESEKIHFRDVLLAQDWIDAFLKEDKPEDRYKKFVTYFGDQSLDKHYNNLIQLINGNELSIKKLKSQYDGINLKLRHDLDSTVLDNVNSIVNQLVGDGEVIGLVDLGYNKADELKLNEKIEQRSIEINNEFSNLSAERKRISDAHIGISDYTLNRNRRSKLNKELAELESLQDKISLKERLTTKLEKVKGTYEGLLVIRNKNKEILDILPKYKKLLSEKEKYESEKVKKEDLIILNEKEFLSINQSLIDGISAIENMTKVLKETEHLLLSLPNLYDEINTRNKSIDSKQLLIENNKPFVQDLKIELEKITAKKDKISIAKREIEFQDFLSPIYEDERIKEIVRSLKISLVLKSEFVELIGENTEKLDEQKSINTELKALLSSGEDLVRKSKNTNCPLCTAKYDSVDLLLEKILNNPAFNQAEKDILDKRSKSEQKLSLEIEKIEGYLTTIKSFIKDLEFNANKEEQILIAKLQKLELQDSELSQAISNTNSELSKLIVKTNNLPIEGCRTTINSNISDQNIKIKELQAKLESYVKQKELIKEKVSKLQGEVSIILSSIEQINNSNEYLSINVYLKSNRLESISELLISENINSTNSSITSVQEDIENNEKQIETLNLGLKSIDEKSLPDVLSKLKNEIKGLDKIIAPISEFINSYVQFDSDSSQKEFENGFIKLASGIDEQKLRIDKIKESYQKLSSSVKNLMPYLEQKELHNRFEEVKKEYNLKKDVLKPELNKEKDKISGYIYRQVESFFHEGLINQIYEKIDPHPEYKEIKFRCDFSGSSPKLNVLVNKEGEEFSNSPALYFSTAQLNVLSLSIFLAKALNAKDENQKPIDCIFLDDPIQSMDSINILSTIDLLRSLSCTYDKQIILSTHEENFFKLLQKKIPKNIYKSRFIELETFGTVKNY